MSEPNYKDQYAVVVGLGKTGFSLARHLRARGARVAVTDTRAEPPYRAQLAQLDAAIPVVTGKLDAGLLEGAQLLAVSPGVSLDDPFFVTARAYQLLPVGDIELFAREARAPILGITGTNGKSTVTSLVAAMARRAGLKVRVGGNLGEPALELLDASAELYVLELSSFQIDLIEQLPLVAATILNVTPDHLDRYGSMERYAASKQRILAHARVAVLNLDDPYVAAMPTPYQQRVGFTTADVVGADYQLLQRSEGTWLAHAGRPLLALADMKMVGLHNAANALAALALGAAAGLSEAVMLEELRHFAGLAHRAQWVADVRGVRYVNDSKGTNIGATLAAVQGLSGPLLMILGGEGKGQDFAPLAPAFRGKVRRALLIGRDARRIAEALAGVCPLQHCATLAEAVRAAAEHAQPGDTVLLSPACASLDMFRDYAHRGASFAAAVQELAA
ncbi:MAG: UDP-N-acetylmuramoyl-L-alanine--D-glutamate ligase [Steroidobacteraceae bacterium]